MLRHILISMLVAIATGSAASAQAAPPPDRIELVLDGSGSMWGQIEGEAKILVARETISDLLTDWPDSVDLGVSAYGHRSEGDCSDIEVIVPMGRFNAEAIRSAVNSVTPLGKTPLTDAVRQAAERISDNEEGGSVILVTDGLETCSGDPCALGRELSENGVALRTHVIGFGLAGEDTSALQCLAEETGGVYLDAENAGELNTALRTVTVEPMESPSLKHIVTLRATKVDGTLLPGEPVVLWSIRSTDDPDFNEAATGSSLLINLPEGEYEITAAHGEDMRLTQTVIVTGEADQNIDFMFADGTISLYPVLTEGADPLSGIFSWVLFQETADGALVQVARDAGTRGRFTVPAGDYVLRFSDEDLRVDTPVSVIADENSETAMNLNAGWLIVNGPAGSNWTLLRLSEDGERTRAASEARASTRFLVPAGEYEIINRSTDGESTQRVILSAGETLEVSF